MKIFKSLLSVLGILLTLLGLIVMAVIDGVIQLVKFKKKGGYRN